MYSVKSNYDKNTTPELHPLQLAKISFQNSPNSSVGDGKPESGVRNPKRRESSVEVDGTVQKYFYIHFNLNFSASGFLR